MSEPGDDSGEGTKQFGVTVSESESDFFEWVAAFRNAMAKARGKKLRRQWTRKTVAESFLSSKTAEERKDFSELLAALGAFPDAHDEVAMLRYAQRVLEWSAKKGK